MDANELEYVGFWPRVGATLIDTLLVSFFTFPLMRMFYGASYWDDFALLRGPADAVINWILPAIATVAFWMARQATPGKMVIGARIVDAATGEPPTLGQCVIRYLGYFVSAVALCLGYVWVAFDPRKQGWHDRLANTVVVRKRTAAVRPVRFDGT